MASRFGFKSQIAFFGTWLFYLAEILLLIAMTMIWPPQGKDANLTVCLILVLPLLPFFPFLYKRSIRAFIVLCYFSLFYLAFAVPSAIDPRYGVLGQIEFALTGLLCASSMMFARWEQKRLGISVTR